MDKLLVELEFDDVSSYVRVKSLVGGSDPLTLKGAMEEHLVDLVDRTSYSCLDAPSFLVCAAQVISWFDLRDLPWEVSMVGKGGKVHKLEHSL